MKKEKMNVTMKIEVNKEDYKLLKEWGFYFEKNIEHYIESAAKELRKAIEEKNSN